MKDDRWTFWRRLLSTAATELFAHYGVGLHDESHWTPVLGAGDHVAASVYFGGEQIRGGLTVCAPRTLLSRATPVPEQATSLADFAREIANQILGGLQFALNEYGVDFSYQFSDPGVLAGGPDTTVDARTLVLRSLGGEVAIIFVVASTVDLGPETVRPPARPSLARGELILL